MYRQAAAGQNPKYDLIVLSEPPIFLIVRRYPRNGLSTGAYFFIFTLNFRWTLIVDVVNRK